MLQCYINDVLRACVDDIVLRYLDDILIVSANEKAHEEHVNKVVQLLKELCLDCNAEKCQFRVLDVCFLGFVITPGGVGIGSDKMSTHEDRQTRNSLGDVQVLLRFMNFYQRFIWKYGKVSDRLTELLNTPEK